MATTTTYARGIPQRADALPLGRGPLLLASDGRSSTEPALRATRQLAQRFQRDVHAVGVLEPALPVYLPPEALLQPLEEGQNGLALLRTRLTRQLRQDLGERAGWSAEVRRGIPAQAVATVARERDASLVVTGLSPHPLVDRVIGNEVPVSLAQLLDRPLLAVAPSWERLPRTILVTVDMSGTSERVARLASALFPEATTIYLVHVMPKPSDAEAAADGWTELYERELSAAYQRIRAAMTTRATVEVVTLRGNVAREVADFARYTKTELIVTGTHVHGMFYRLLFGNVATKLLRAADTSVLLIPETEPVASPLTAPRTTVIPRDDWSARLRDISRRNRARRVALEIDEPEVGAVFQVYDYPFLGVDFDTRGNRVQLMLGEGTPNGRMLTHTIGEPTSIDLLTAPQGRDSALRIAYKGGQAILIFLIEEHAPLWSSE